MSNTKKHPLNLSLQIFILSEILVLQKHPKITTVPDNFQLKVVFYSSIFTI